MNTKKIITKLVYINDTFVVAAAETAKVTSKEVTSDDMLPAKSGSIAVDDTRVISSPSDMFTRNQVKTPTNRPEMIKNMKLFTILK